MKRTLATIVASAALIAAPLTAHATPDDHDPVWVTWIVNPSAGDPHGQEGAPAIFPQALAGLGKVDPGCGEWVQQDLYAQDTKAKRALLDQLLAAEVLRHANGSPQDAPIYLEHRFVQGPDWQATDPTAPCFTGPDQPAPEQRTDEGEPVVTCETVTVESVTRTAEYAWDGTAWVLGEWVETSRASSQRAATEAETAGLDCGDEPVVPEPPVTPEPPAAPEPPAEPVVEDEPEVDRSPLTARTGDRVELAETGIDLGWLTLAAFVLVGLGGSIVVLRRKGVRR